MIPLSEKDTWYRNEILRLKKEKNAVILAHYYQNNEIQELADYVGDSLGLSQEAKKTNGSMIVFCGVHFMGETAKILNPHKKVLIPDMDAGCSLADDCPADEFAAFKAKHPNHLVISYINCSAEVKAMSDIICTSSNAVKIVNSLPKDTPIIFAPDANLGRYVAQKTGRNLVLWEGACMVHLAISEEKLNLIQHENPTAILIAHPECTKNILEKAAFIGSTTALINYVEKSTAQSFIVATESGVLYQMKLQSPHKKIIPAPMQQNNSCACAECPYMKLNTLEKIYLALRDEKPEIILNEDIRKKAEQAIEKMLALS